MWTFISHNTRLSVLKCSLFRVASFSTQIEHESKKNIGKIVHVAILGAPNSGKSTLINNIVERKICAASNKVHTTTKLIRAMCYYDNTQIIFLDTPGVVTEKEQKKYNLPESMIKACYKSLRCADVVGIVHDVSNRFTRDSIHMDVLSMLKTMEAIPSFLILNKVDKLKDKKQLLTIIRNLTNGMIAGSPMPGAKKGKNLSTPDRGYSHFSDVFLVSALKGDGIQDIKQYLISNAKIANFHYSPEEWTDQTPELLIEETVRAKFLDFLAQEIPYKLSTQLEYYEENTEEDKIVCSVTVECPTERIAKLIAGAGGGRLNKIKSYIRQDLIDIFKKIVVIDLRLKVKSKPLME